ncbi:MAG: DUF308 domain-containing protein [Bacteroidota bacterium]
MDTSLNKWWLITLKGILFCALGAILLVHPYVATEAIAIFFGTTLLITGVLYVVFSIYNQSNLTWWKWYLAEGAFDIFLGLLIFLFPITTLIASAFLGGIWIIFIGVFQLAFSWQIKDKIDGWKYATGNGIIALLIGGSIVRYPMGGVIAFAFIFGIVLLYYGVSLIILSLKLKNFATKRLVND